MFIHAGTDSRHFILPTPARGIAWRLFLNTAADSPEDIYPSLDGPPLAQNGIVTMEARSLAVYVAREAPPALGVTARKRASPTSLGWPIAARPPRYRIGQPPCWPMTSSISAIRRMVSLRATTTFW